MKTVLSSNSIRALNHSMPLMKRHSRDLAAGMKRYLAHCVSPASSAAPDVASRVIMDMLFDHASEIGGEVALFQLAETARRHRIHGLDPAHYTCFGDGFAAVMKDVLGKGASSAVLAAWVDAYWEIVRSLRRQDLAMAA